MTENTTKVVSARLPLGSYLQIAAAAGEKKMTIADFVLLKLFAHPDPSAQPLQQANKLIQQLNEQVTTLETSNAKLARAYKDWMDQAEVLQIDYKLLSDEQDQERRQSKHLSQELVKLKADSTTLTQQLQTAQTQQLAAQKRLQDLRQALADEHNKSNSRNQMPEQYWDIIEHFVPKKR